MKQLALIALLLLSLPSSAAEWIRVRAIAEGDQYFYDRSKLYINGDEITYWKKVIFKIPSTVKGQAAASGLYRERIHCNEHTLKLISYLLYAADGSTIEYIASHEGDAAPIIPDTVGDIFEKTACDLVRQKQAAARQQNQAQEEARKAEDEKGQAASTGSSDIKPKLPAEKTHQPGHEPVPNIPANSPPAVVN